MHACDGAYVRVCVCASVCMSVCARARGFCADARAGARICVRVGARTYVRAGAREYMRVCESAHVSVCASACVCGRACVCASVGVLAYVRVYVRACGCISKLCRPLTHRQANYHSKNYYNHNNLQRQKG